MDVAKAIALGASLAGMALPFARAVHEAGTEAALRLIARVESSLRTAMTLTGCADLSALRARPLQIEPALSAAADELLRAEDARP